MKIRNKLILAASMVILSQKIFAQSDSTASLSDELSLEDLMNVPVTVASSKELSPRESPGIISVITEEDIKKTGARDLIDVLGMVPGISFGFDVQGIAGIAMRGNWGHEGKVLLMIDGQTMNEHLYSTTQFDHHYDVNQIKRIEIIRGPGSSMYGGYAELGVINIITKKGEDHQGVNITGMVGAMTDPYLIGRANVSIGGGVKKDDLDISVSGFYGQGTRSSKTFTDYNDSTVTMGNGASEIINYSTNIGIQYKNLKFRSIYDQVNFNSPIFYDILSNTSINNTFINFTNELSYDIKISDKFTLTPKLNYTFQNPWRTIKPNYISDTDTGYYYDINTTRTLANITANYSPSDAINILAGIEYYYDYAFNNDETQAFSNSKRYISYHTTNGFLQFLWKNKIVNVTVGGKYLHHNIFGGAFAPRVALTKVVNKFHAKLLGSLAFRTPSIANIEINPSIKPERTLVVELELGYQITKDLMVSANLFDITIFDPIIYYVDSTGEGYKNYTQTGTRGFEIDAKFRKKWGYINANYSFYSAANKNNVDVYASNTGSEQLIGMAPHILNITAGFNITENLNANITYQMISERRGFDNSYLEFNTTTSSFDRMLGESTIPAHHLVNLFVQYDNLFTKGLNFGIGVKNILDQKYVFVQPYNGGHRPVNGLQREITFRLSYTIK